MTVEEYAASLAGTLTAALAGHTLAGPPMPHSLLLSPDSQDKAAVEAVVAASPGAFLRRSIDGFNYGYQACVADPTPVQVEALTSEGWILWERCRDCGGSGREVRPDNGNEDVCGGCWGRGYHYAD